MMGAADAERDQAPPEGPEGEPWHPMPGTPAEEVRMQRKRALLALRSAALGDPASYPPRVGIEDALGCPRHRADRLGLGSKAELHHRAVIRPEAPIGDPVAGRH